MIELVCFLPMKSFIFHVDVSLFHSHNGEMVNEVRKTYPTSLQHNKCTRAVKKITERRGVQVERLVHCSLAISTPCHWTSNC